MKHCKYYLPWAIVATSYSQEEINNACVNKEKRTIKRCGFKWDCQGECPDFEEDKK